MTDPTLERLARANPETEPAPGGPDPERDALLARLLAEPAEAPRPPRRRVQVPRPRLTLPALGAAVAAAVVLVVLGASGPGKPGFAEQAYAAVTGENAIFHTVVVSRFSGDLDADERRTQVVDTRYDLKRPGLRVLAYEIRDGRRVLAYESAGDRSGVRTRFPDTPGFGRRDSGRDLRTYDPLDDFKAAYRAGKVLSERATTYAGRPAFTIRVDTRPTTSPQREVTPSSEATYVFDRATKLPLEQSGTTVQILDGRRITIGYRSRYEVVERLPRTPAELAKLRFRGP